MVITLDQLFLSCKLSFFLVLPGVNNCSAFKNLGTGCQGGVLHGGKIFYGDTGILLLETDSAQAAHPKFLKSHKNNENLFSFVEPASLNISSWNKFTHKILLRNECPRKEWSSNLRIHKNHLEKLLKYIPWLLPRNSDSRGLGYSLRTCIFLQAPSQSNLQIWELHLSSISTKQFLRCSSRMLDPWYGLNCIRPTASEIQILKF